MKKIPQKIFSEIYRTLRKERFPTEVMLAVPSPGSFNDELMKRCYEAGYEAAKKEKEK